MVLDTRVRDKYVTVNGLRLHYRDWGDQGAPPLLILHGLTGHAWEFDGVAEALSERFHVMSLNQRGHGASEWAEEYSPQVMADDVAAFVETLGLGKLPVIGHSMGGVNGWWYAAQHPEVVERFVILDICPQAVTNPDNAAWFDEALAAYAAGEFATVEDGIAAYMEGSDDPHDQALREFARNNLTQREDGRWVWRFDARRLGRWFQGVTEQERHWEMLRKVACPVLVVMGGDSPFTEASEGEQIAAAVPDGRCVVIPGAGHDIHFDQFDALMTELWGFLTAE